MTQHAPFDELATEIAGNLLPSPTASHDDTFDHDVFDGIEDIYDDLEAAPQLAPPSSPDDMLYATQCIMSRSRCGVMEMDPPKEFSCANDDVAANPFFCGMDTPNESSGAKSFWDLLKISKYSEMKEDGTSHDADEILSKVRKTGERPKDAKEGNGTSAAIDRDTVIQHTIADGDIGVEETKKKYPSFSEVLERIKKALAARTAQVWSKTNDEPNTSKDDTVIQLSLDEDVEEIRKSKEKKYSPSLWKVLGERKFHGVSYRLIILVSVNVLAFILLTFLIMRFTGRKQHQLDVDPLTDGAIPNDVEEVNVNVELLKLCDLEGATLEDGIILKQNEVMTHGDYFCSPSKTHMVGMVDDFAIINISENRVVWSAGVLGGYRAVLQDDGNFVLENQDGLILWSTGPIPEGNDDFAPQLVFWGNNDGAIAVQQVSTTDDSTRAPFNFWMDGAPKSVYCDECVTNDLQFPVRGTFYFPNYNGTETAWSNEAGDLPQHSPSLGWYSSSDEGVVKAHIEGMEYANIDLAISSWDGPGANFDRSRMSMLLEETSAQHASLKWTMNYEGERNDHPSPEQIQSDLVYLKTWFAWQDSWAHVNGKPVIFVNNVPGCDVVERWMRGAASDWYVVLRVFEGFRRCIYQPDSWHDQRVNDGNDGIDIVPGMFYNLAPGEWTSGRDRPEMERLSPREWCNHVEDMERSNAQWQLITSFNEANKGTSIEPSSDWSSDSQYGSFLDCLHDATLF